MKEPPRALIASLSREALLTCDVDGSILWLDERAARLLPGASVGRSLEGWALPGTIDRLRDTLAVCTSRSAAARELPLNLAHGPESVWVECRAHEGALVILMRRHDPGMEEAVLGATSSLADVVELNRRLLFERRRAQADGEGLRAELAREKESAAGLRLLADALQVRCGRSSGPERFALEELLAGIHAALRHLSPPGVALPVETPATHAEVVLDRSALSSLLLELAGQALALERGKLRVDVAPASIGVHLEGGAVCTSPALEQAVHLLGGSLDRHAVVVPSGR